MTGRKTRISPVYNLCWRVNEILNNSPHIDVAWAEVTFGNDFTICYKLISNSVNRILLWFRGAEEMTLDRAWIKALPKESSCVTLVMQSPNHTGAQLLKTLWTCDVTYVMRLCQHWFNVMAWRPFFRPQSIMPLITKIVGFIHSSGLKRPLSCGSHMISIMHI